MTASADGSAKIWRSTTGECLSTFTGHEKSVYSAAFSADGASVLTASMDATTKIWNSTNGECLSTLTGHENVVKSAAFSSDSTLIVTASVNQPHGQGLERHDRRLFVDARRARQGRVSCGILWVLKY